MAATSYEYDVINDFPNSIVDNDALQYQVEQSGITSADVTHINTSWKGDPLREKCDIWFDDPLSSGDETLLDGVVAAHDGAPLEGTVRVGGGLIIEELDTPSAPTVVPQGTPGATTWGYKVTAWSDTGETLASTETQITNGNAVLTATDFNRISWDIVEGSVKYSVYRTTSGGTPSSTGLIKVTTAKDYDDKGDTASGSTPSEDLSGALLVGTGDVSIGKLVTIKEVTSDYSTVSSLIHMARRSSGTPVAGFGAGIYFELDDATNVLRALGSLHMLWSDADASDLEADFRVVLRDGVSATLQERLRLTHDGRLELSGTEVLGIGTCRAVHSPSNGFIGGNAAASSNNDRMSVTFDVAGESRIRWTMKPPANYVSGDLVFRLLCSISGNPGKKGIRLELHWDCDEVGSAFSSSLTYSSVQTFDTDPVSSDTPFSIDFSILSSQYDNSKDIMAFKVLRDGDHSEDDCNYSLHIHSMELRYSGYLLAGQAGQ